MGLLKLEGPCRQLSLQLSHGQGRLRQEGWRVGATSLHSAGKHGQGTLNQGNWHQMLPDLPHPPGSWKHLFV